MQALFDKFKNILVNENYKLTSQRKDILHILIKNQHKHFSAETLQKEVKKINPHIGLATIYRNLEIFCKLGITTQLEFDSSFKYYELNVEENHHHHLICIKCGNIIEFNDKALEKLEKKLEIKHGFDIVSHRIKFYGICSKCSKK